MLQRPTYSIGKLSHGLAIVVATTPAGLVSVGQPTFNHGALVRLSGIVAAWAIAAACGLRFSLPEFEPGTAAEVAA